MDLIYLLCHVLTRSMLCRGPSLQIKKKKEKKKSLLFLITYLRLSYVKNISTSVHPS